MVMSRHCSSIIAMLRQWGTFWSLCRDIAVTVDIEREFSQHWSLCCDVVVDIEKEFSSSRFLLVYPFLFISLNLNMLVNTYLKKLKHLKSSMENKDNFSIQGTSKFNKYSL